MGAYSNTVSGAYADKIKAVYEHLYEIKKVADRLTPVDDLESFQTQIEDIHANLDVMVEASNLLVTATEVGETVLTASSWQALKILLGVDQLHPDSVTVAMLVTALEELEQRIQSQIDALVIPSLDTIHTSLSGLQGSINAITVDVSGIQGTLSAQQTLVFGLQNSYLDTLSGISANQSNITSALSRLSMVEGAQIIQDNKYTTLSQSYTNLQTGLSAANSSLSGQAASITILEGKTELHNSAITQLSSDLLNTNSNISGHSDALDTISTTLIGIGNDLIAQANQTTALKSAIGGSGNLLPNADFAVMADGWVKTVGQGDWAATVLAVNDFVRPSGVNSLDLTGAPSPSGQIVVESPPVLVSGDGFYAISGYPCASNGVATLGWRAYNSSGGLMAQGMCPPASNPVNNSDLSAYTRVWHNFQVYPGTTHIKLYFSVMADGDGVSLGSLFRPMVEKSWADQVGPSAWTPNLAGVGDAMSTALNELSTEVSQIGDTVTAVSESNLALQSQITVAVGTITEQDAQIAAARAEVAASKGRIDRIYDDSIISESEKPQLIIDYNAVVDEYPGIRAEAEAAEITVELTAYGTAYDALMNYMNTLTTPVRWDNTSDYTELT